MFNVKFEPERVFQSAATEEIFKSQKNKIKNKNNLHNVVLKTAK